jgi:hypothetical protein
MINIWKLWKLKIVNVNVTWFIWALWAEELCMWMLHDEYECFVSWTIVYVNVTWWKWMLCELNNCSCECCMMKMNDLWVEQLCMWILHDENECFVSWIIVYVNVTWWKWMLCELNNCVYECYMMNMKALWVEQLCMWMLHDEYECFVSWT